jgi:hypothetical protein
MERLSETLRSRAHKVREAKETKLVYTSTTSSENATQLFYEGILWELRLAALNGRNEVSCQILSRVAYGPYQIRFFRGPIPTDGERALAMQVIAQATASLRTKGFEASFDDASLTFRAGF